MQAKKKGLPPPRCEDKQRMFFETRQLNPGSCRHFTGDFFELANVALVGGQRLRTHSQYATCPDIHWRDNICFECKSVGRTNAAIIYSIRISRDRKFVARGYRLYYWFWHHNCKVSQFDLVSELNAGLAKSVCDVVVVPFEALDRWLKGRPTKVMNTGQVSSRGKRVGWGSRGYGVGWGVPVSEMRELATAERQITGLEAEGESFSDFPLFGHLQMPFLSQNGVSDNDKIETICLDHPFQLVSGRGR